MSDFSARPTAVKLLVLRQMVAEQTQEGDLVQLYRDLYDGVKGPVLTDRMQEYLGTGDNVSDNVDFLINFMPLVVDVPAERLEVEGFDVTGNDAAEALLAGDEGLLQRWWKQNRMDAAQLDVNVSARRDGETFVLVEWDNTNGRPRLVHELKYASGTAEGMKVHRDPGDRHVIIAASKRWQDYAADGEPVRRRNLYYADRVEKYVMDTSFDGTQYDEAGWVPYIETDPDTGVELPWPRPWVDPDTGEPLGVPVVPFTYGGAGFAGGVSAIERARGAQYARNKADIDLLAAADAAGFPMDVLLGDTFPDDTAWGPGHVVSIEGKPTSETTPSFMRLPAADLMPMIETSMHFTRAVAQVSRVPLSYFQISRQQQSAEGMQQNDASLLALVRAWSKGMGNSWEDVMALAVRLHNAFGDGDAVEGEYLLDTVWRDIEIRNEELRAKQRADTAAVLVRDTDADPVAAYKLAGYTQEEAEALAVNGFLLGTEEQR